MRLFFAIVLLACTLGSAPAIAATVAPEPIMPDQLRWVGPPAIPGLQAAWIIGADQRPGPYILRVKLASGTRIPPHRHPDERNTTVLSGTVAVGFGETFDAAKVVTIPAGAVYIAPADVPHFIWAKDGDALYQEAGFGPTATTFTK